MRKIKIGNLLVLFVFTIAPAIWTGGAMAQATTTAQSEAGFAGLQGRWGRTEGAYTITINGVDANGKLDASYANPDPVPFSKAQATREGSVLKLFFEIQAPGYNGSTYRLTYGPVKQALTGEYYQAAAQQKFDVYFARMK